MGYIGIGVQLFSYILDIREQLIRGYILCGRSLNWGRSFLLLGGGET